MCIIILQIWQGTVSSLLELSVVHIILITIPNNSTVVLYGVPILSLLIGLSRDRLFQFLYKLYFVFHILFLMFSEKNEKKNWWKYELFPSCKSKDHCTSSADDCVLNFQSCQTKTNKCVSAASPLSTHVQP
jgi:hypothetical protein